MRGRFGLRTAAMLVLGYVWVGIGFGAFLEVPQPRPGVFHTLIPASVRGALWFGTALLACVTAWSRRASPLGLAGLFLMPAVYLVSYALSWVLSLVDGGNPGFTNGWYSAYLYLGLTAFVIITAFIPSRSVLVVNVPTDKEGRR